ncbi:MAG: amino acid-binding protein [Lentisphaeria bacterium]|jgi:hypothetical protein|nr:amino acid-binding protein [Lentisphaeria bacterium]MDD6336937.1 amino acid-binding protein [Lentisphaeria bacterium]
MKLKQISLFVENKPGTVNEALKLLAANGINISTLSLSDTKFFGVLRLLVRDWEKARDILEANHLAVKITDVVAIEVDHAAGSLTKVLEVLDRHQVNIEYLYAFAAGLHGKAAIIFRFADPDDAIAKIKSELKIVEPLDLFRELPE